MRVIVQTCSFICARLNVAEARKFLKSVISESVGRLCASCGENILPKTDMAILFTKKYQMFVQIKISGSTEQFLIATLQAFAHWNQESGCFANAVVHRRFWACLLFTRVGIQPRSWWLHCYQGQVIFGLGWCPGLPLTKRICNLNLYYGALQQRGLEYAIVSRLKYKFIVHR